MIEVCHKEKCSGCGACVNVCAHAAISWSTDEEGFNYPVIDQQKCIDCGLCVKKCPNNSDYQPIEYEKKVYAAYSYSWQKHGSSGGLFSAIAADCLKNGGYVVGAAFDKDFKLSQTVIHDMDDLPKLQGSKYSQSSSYMSFQNVKSLLREGKRVFYCGTPCQIAGLLNFIPKRLQENLLTADLVCHGVPSQRAFDKVVAFIKEQYHTMPEDFGYRLTECQSISPFVKISKKKLLTNGDIDCYMNAFYKFLLFRPSCYNCQFSSIKRPGDITLADYWGLKGFKKRMPQYSGVSMLIINSENGLKAFNQIRDDLYFEERPLEQAIQGQHNLQKPSERPAERDRSAKDFLDLSLHDFGAKYNLLPKNQSVYHLKFFLKQVTIKLGIFKYLNKK